MTERKLAVRVVSPGGGALGERIYELGPSTKRLAVLHHSAPLDLGWFEGISARLLKMGVDEVLALEPGAKLSILEIVDEVITATR